MNPLPLFDTAAGRGGAVLALVCGLLLVWLGLTGGSDPTRALARRHVPMLRRIEAFRVFMTGLVLLGVGGAVLSQAPWLFWLALGIGFVELRESSTLIAVWRSRPPSGVARRALR
ncbi:MAG: hypothetical protein QM692_06205 [Thermomicrobiales bacterium]